MSWIPFFRRTKGGRGRRACLYGVGLGKSGTHSLAGMFAGTLRVGHEAEAGELIQEILAWRQGRLSERDFRVWLRARDRRLALEVDSSSLNFWLVDFLLREFPDARFVLTIRDCYSWTNSFLNHWLTRPVVEARWAGLNELRFGSAAGPFAPGEQRLKELGFYPLAAYLKYWTTHNAQMMEKIPPARLLVVRTDQLRERALEIATFAGVPHHLVNLDKIHEFSNPAKQDLLRPMGTDLVEQEAGRQCGALMAKFFPEIKSLSDAPR